MPPFSRDAYRFTAQKRLGRSERISEVAVDVATVFSKIARDKHSCPHPVTFRTGRLDDLVNSYFERVIRFKWEHGFDPISKINQPKMVALMVEAIFEEQDKDPLFYIPASINTPDFEDDLIYEFIYAIAVSNLFIRIDEVPVEHKRDFIMCLHRYEVHTEWLAWALYNFCVAYGELLNVGE